MRKKSIEAIEAIEAKEEEELRTRIREAQSLVELKSIIADHHYFGIPHDVVPKVHGDLDEFNAALNNLSDEELTSEDEFGEITNQVFTDYSHSMEEGLSESLDNPTGARSIIDRMITLEKKRRSLIG